MIDAFEGLVTDVDFNDCDDCNPARTPSLSYYYYGADLFHDPKDGGYWSGPTTVNVRCSDGSDLATIHCVDAGAAERVLTALVGLDGPTLALTVGLLWSLLREVRVVRTADEVDAMDARMDTILSALMVNQSFNSNEVTA